MKLTEVDDSSGDPIYRIEYQVEKGFELYVHGGHLDDFETFADAEAVMKMLVAGGSFQYDKYGKRVYKPVPKE